MVNGWTVSGHRNFRIYKRTSSIGLNRIRQSEIFISPSVNGGFIIDGKVYDSIIGPNGEQFLHKIHRDRKFEAKNIGTIEKKRITWMKEFDKFFR